MSISYYGEWEDPMTMDLPLLIDMWNDYVRWGADYDYSLWVSNLDTMWEALYDRGVVGTLYLPFGPLQLLEKEG